MYDSVSQRIRLIERYNGHLGERGKWQERWSLWDGMGCNMTPASFGLQHLPVFFFFSGVQHYYYYFLKMFIVVYLIPNKSRRGGLMVSALISGSNCPGASPSWGHCVVFLCPKCLSTPKQVYKWVPANLMPGVAL